MADELEQFLTDLDAPDPRPHIVTCRLDTTTRALVALVIEAERLPTIDAFLNRAVAAYLRGFAERVWPTKHLD